MQVRGCLRTTKSALRVRLKPAWGMTKPPRQNTDRGESLIRSGTRTSKLEMKYASAHAKLPRVRRGLPRQHNRRPGDDDLRRAEVRRGVPAGCLNLLHAHLAAGFVDPYRLGRGPAFV